MGCEKKINNYYVTLEWHVQDLCLSYWYKIRTDKPSNTNGMSYMYRFMHFEHECVWATQWEPLFPNKQNNLFNFQTYLPVYYVSHDKEV